MSFENTILLRLHRQYSQDEAVSYLLAEVKELKFRLGELTSENAELKHELNQATKWSKAKEVVIWRDRYLSLLNRNPQTGVQGSQEKKQ